MLLTPLSGQTQWFFQGPHRQIKFPAASNTFVYRSISLPQEKRHLHGHRVYNSGILHVSPRGCELNHRLAKSRDLAWQESTKFHPFPLFSASGPAIRIFLQVIINRLYRIQIPLHL
jgi:hypothetical protein